MAARRVTIHDVAEAAGVSSTTVSHVLSGKGRVRPDTRARVQQTVAVLGYRANPLARNLRQARFGALGLYLPDWSLSFQHYVDLAISASSTVFEHGGGLTLLPAVADPSELLTLPLDGVIVAEPVIDDPVVEAMTAARLPIALCEGPSTLRAKDVHVLVNDHEGVTREMLDHLVEEGAHDIAILGSDPTTWWGRLFAEAVQSWQAQSGTSLRWVYLPISCTAEQTRDAVETLFDEAVPDALVIAQQGFGPVVMAASKARGLRVPDDLMIACYVDGPDLLVTSPAITAVDPLPRAMGRLAAQALLEPDDAREWSVRPELRRRGSSQRSGRGPASR